MASLLGYGKSDDRISVTFDGDAQRPRRRLSPNATPAPVFAAVVAAVALRMVLVAMYSAFWYVAAFSVLGFVAAAVVLGTLFSNTSCSGRQIVSFPLF
mgnify:CR=1 FL=1